MAKYLNPKCIRRGDPIVVVDWGSVYAEWTVKNGEVSYCGISAENKGKVLSTEWEPNCYGVHGMGDYVVHIKLKDGTFVDISYRGLKRLSKVKAALYGI